MILITNSRKITEREVGGSYNFVILRDLVSTQSAYKLWMLKNHFPYLILNFYFLFYFRLFTVSFFLSFLSFFLFPSLFIATRNRTFIYETLSQHAEMFMANFFFLSFFNPSLRFVLYLSVYLSPPSCLSKSDLSC